MAYTPLTSYPNFGTRIAVPPIALPASVADATTYSTDLMPSGFAGVVFAATSSRIVTLQIQRFADLAGLIPIGGLLSQALVAATPGFVGATDGLPFVSWAAAIVNASGGAALITNAKLLTGGTI